MSRDVKILAAVLGTAGVLHFVRPEPFQKIVPKALPRKKELVYASGVVEVASAALLLRPSTRRAGGRLAALLLISVFPANVQMTADGFRSRKAPTWYKVGLVLRLPLQVPMIRAAQKAARGEA